MSLLKILELNYPGLNTSSNSADELLEELSFNYKIYVLAPRNPNIVKGWLIQNNLWKHIEDVIDKKIPVDVYIDENGINCQFNLSK